MNATDAGELAGLASKAEVALDALRSRAAELAEHGSPHTRADLSTLAGTAAVCGRLRINCTRLEREAITAAAAVHDAGD